MAGAPGAAQLGPDATVDSFLVAAEQLLAPVDAFFEKVFVMTDDEAVRRNRLALLRCEPSAVALSWGLGFRLSVRFMALKPCQVTAEAVVAGTTGWTPQVSGALRYKRGLAHMASTPGLRTLTPTL